MARFLLEHGADPAFRGALGTMGEVYRDSRYRAPPVRPPRPPRPPLNGG